VIDRGFIQSETPGRSVRLWQRIVDRSIGLVALVDGERRSNITLNWWLLVDRSIGSFWRDRCLEDSRRGSAGKAQEG